MSADRDAIRRNLEEVRADRGGGGSRRPSSGRRDARGRHEDRRRGPDPVGRRGRRLDAGRELRAGARSQARGGRGSDVALRRDPPLGDGPSGRGSRGRRGDRGGGAGGAAARRPRRPRRQDARRADRGVARGGPRGGVAGGPLGVRRPRRRSRGASARRTDDDPPFHDDPEASRPYFARLRTLGEDLRRHHPKVLESSMGMSLDYEVAVEEGATMVRIGTALFGHRPTREEPG